MIKLRLQNSAVESSHGCRHVSHAPNWHTIYNKVMS